MADIQFFILDKSFQVVDIVDTFQSVIWNERYDECGDFEIYVDASIANLRRFPRGYYVYLEGSPSTMVIDQVKIESDVEEGDKLVVTGRSLESLLMRRVIPKHVIYKDDIQTTIKTILDENVISPSEARRKIANFDFVTKTLSDTKPSTEDGYEFDGDTIYDAIKTIVDSKGYGFRLALRGEEHWANTKMAFEIYEGLDRSYEQDDNPYVVFSSNYGNLISSNTTMDYRELYNAAYVGGSEQTKDNQTKRLVAYVPNQDGSTGWDYFETFYSASSVRYEDDEGNPRPDDQVIAALKAEGIDELRQVGSGISFDAEVSAVESMVYQTDYFIGDIVQIENNYNMSYKARITEYVRNWDTSSGYSEYPVLEVIDVKYQSIDDSSGIPIRDDLDTPIHSSVETDY